MCRESLWVLKQVAVGVFPRGGLVLKLLMRISHNCCRDNDVVTVVERPFCPVCHI